MNIFKAHKGLKDEAQNFLNHLQNQKKKKKHEDYQIRSGRITFYIISCKISHEGDINNSQTYSSYELYEYPQFDIRRLELHFESQRLTGTILKI